MENEIGKITTGLEQLPLPSSSHPDQSESFGCAHEFCCENLPEPHRHQPWKGEFKLIGELQNPSYNHRFKLPPKYTYGCGYKKNGEAIEKIDLDHVIQNLPSVISAIKEPSSPYMELAHVTSAIRQLLSPYEELAQNVHESKIVRDKPYTQEIKANPYDMEKYAENELSGVYAIDCEYIISISIPKILDYSLRHTEYDTGTDISPFFENRTHWRWIFIPSSDRSGKDVILDRRGCSCSSAETICFVVVRPNQFDKYREKVGDKVAIIRLPDNVIGVGYARYWVVKIAKRFEKQWIWMCDDSVTWFKEYIPETDERRVVIGKDPDGPYREKNPRCDHLCFDEMEKIMEANKSNLALIGPRTHMQLLNMKEEFTYKPPQGVVLLNIELIAEEGLKNLNYRPELLYLEDMIFAKECTNKGLQVCVWNRFVYYDTNYRSSGVNSPNKSKNIQT